MRNFYARFLILTDEIERTYSVHHWWVGDVPVWPVARAALYLNLYRQSVQGLQQQPHVLRPNPLFGRIGRAARYAATPLINAWRSRRDLQNMVVFPRRADVLFLGDGEWLEQIDGVWCDRLCDPLISHLHEKGVSTLLMQRGDLRLPWSRPTFAANTIVNWARLFAVGSGLSKRLARRLPDHERVMEFLRANGVPTDGLQTNDLSDRAAIITAGAYAFERLLKVVRPSMCIMVGYFWGMAHAMTLACRRRGVLSVELQREGRRTEAYCWSVIPESGYPVLPAVFWCWTPEEAAGIDVWCKNLNAPWHRGLHGGHPQMPQWFDDDDAQTRISDAEIATIRAQAPADLEILVALQDIDGHQHVWKELVALVEAAPSQWRWWLRRHPRKPTRGDGGVAPLLAIRRPNVLIDEPSRRPLPALLRHMHVLLSLTSGSSVEASMFGVKPIFLTSDALASFPHLLETGKAEIIENMHAIEMRLRNITREPKTRSPPPKISDVFSRLRSMAAEYSSLCVVR